MYGFANNASNSHLLIEPATLEYLINSSTKFTHMNNQNNKFSATCNFRQYPTHLYHHYFIGWCCHYSFLLYLSKNNYSSKIHLRTTPVTNANRLNWKKHQLKIVVYDKKLLKNPKFCSCMKFPTLFTPCKRKYDGFVS